MRSGMEFHDYIGHLIHQFGSSTWARGHEYHSESRAVLGSTWHNEDTDIAYCDGTVLGSCKVPYEVVVALLRCDDSIEVEGQCTCPINRNCKHVVALLLELAASPTLLAHVLAGETAVEQMERQANNVRGLYARSRPHVSAPMKDALMGLIDSDRDAASGSQSANRSRQALVFLLDHVASTTGDSAGVRIKIIKANRLKAGGFGKNTAFSADFLDARRVWHLPKYLQNGDVELLRLLQGCAKTTTSHDDPGFAQVRTRRRIG